MTRWPPLIWVLMALGSVLLLVGYNGADISVPALVVGGLLAVAGAGLAFWLAFGRWGDRDTPEHSDAERVAEPDRRFERRRDHARHSSG